MSGFRYDDAQWREIAAIVERAGGAAARERLEAQRVSLEKLIVVQKRRFDEPENEAHAKNRALRYQRIEAASADLKAALRDFNLARSMGNDLEWKRLADTQEREQRLVNFRSTLDHIHRVAEKRMTPRRRVMNKGRDLLFKRLARFWEEDLGLPWARSDKSRMMAFIAAACGSVYEIKGKNPRLTIRNALRNGKLADLKWA